ncbi:hypothetical protein HDU81_005192 [Chytriomyces hyalinus]|nr:hypothetical protein HDU81_005192 [Chytriomyces hyalinus]
MKFVILLLLRLALTASALAACSSWRTRKEWRDLSVAEKESFINALNVVRENGKYAQYVKVHAQYLQSIHGRPLFLPWHREMLRRFEDELRKVDPSVTLPYWDWSNEGGNPINLNPQLFGAGSTIASYVVNAPDYGHFLSRIEADHNRVHAGIGGQNGDMYRANIRNGFSGITIRQSMQGNGSDRWCIRYQAYSKIRSNAPKRRDSSVLQRRAQAGDGFVLHPGKTRCGSGKYKTHPRRPYEPLSDQWITMTAKLMNQTKSAVEKQVRASERASLALSKQYDDALDKYFQEKPSATYQEGFTHVISSWTWTGSDV